MGPGSSQGPLGLTPGEHGGDAAADTAIVQHRLGNGMDVVVIPDHRAPVVTHMVWYRNGSADDPLGKSGIAHFLEHLMFKGTAQNPAGKFSDLVSDLGGQENAFTSNDYTAYFQRIPKEHLAICMEYEADRMKNLVLTDEVVQPRYQRLHLVPSYRTGKPGEAEALEVFSYLLGGGQTSVLFKRLVMEQRIAVAAGAHYIGTALDDTRLFIYAVPAPGVSLERLESAVEDVLAEMRRVGVGAADMARAKTRLVAEAIYARDSQMLLANWYGASLTTGLTLDDIAQWPERIEAVTDADVAGVLPYLDVKRSVSGYLLPAEAA